MNDTDIIVRSKQTDFKAGLKVTKLSLLINAGLIVIKTIAGIVGNSYALLSDALHSLSDLATDLITLLSLNFSSKPKDMNHLYGHGKIENYSAHILGIILTLTGIYMGFVSLKSIYPHTPSGQTGIITLFAALISIIVKEFLYRICARAAKKIKSRSLLANAWHHRTDAMSSVAAFFGVACSYFHPAWHVMDNYMSVVIALFVVHTGLSIMIKSFKDIIDTSPPESVCKDIINETTSITGVIDAHDLRARYYSSCIYVDLHIAVDPHITVKQGHDIAKSVEIRLKTTFNDIYDVTVHIDPYEDQ